MDACTWTLVGRVDDVEPEAFWHIGPGARVAQQRAVPVLDVGEPVHVELEDLRGVLHAQSVTGAKVLVDPDM
jgi:hypothetical protein